MSEQTQHHNLRRSSSPRRHVRSFTLVEVLLAVVLGSMLLATSSVIAVQCFASRGAVADEVETRWARRRVFDQFEADVTAACTWLPAETAVFEKGEDAGSLLSILALADAPTLQSPFRRRLPARIVYRVHEADGGHGRRLIRDVTFLTDPAGLSHRRVVAEGLTSVEIEQFSDTRWSGFGSDERGEAKPTMALRLTCQWADGREGGNARTVLLPSAYVERER